MSQQPNTPNGDAAGAQQGGQQPSLNVLAQYIKDFSFENPNAPQVLTNLPKKPDIQLNVNVNTARLNETDVEVALHLEARCVSEETVIYHADLTFAGVFRVKNLPQEAMEPVLLIECPRLLFPFARQIIGDAVRDGSFPPLYLDPIDFAALYRQRLARAAQQQQPQEPQQG